MKELNRNTGLFFILTMGIMLLMTGCGKGNTQAENVLSEDTIKISSEIKKQNLFSGKVQVGNQVIDMPCDVATLLKCDVVTSDEQINEQYLLDAGAQLDVPMNLAGMTFLATVKNETTATQRLENCMVFSLKNLTGGLIVFPGGIAPGKSTYEDVTKAWGESQLSGNTGNENDEEDIQTTLDTGEEVLCDSFYEEGVAKKDVYAYESGRSEEDASEIVNLGGSMYDVLYNRSTGVVYGMNASFGHKYGSKEYESLTYHFSGMDVKFDVLKDAIEVDTEDPLYYCIETIDGVDYLIGVGAVNSSFDEQGTLLDMDNGEEDSDVSEDETEDVQDDEGGKKEKKTKINELTQQFLTYGNYDFSEKYTVVRDEENYKSFSGESVSESVYFCISAEMMKRTACELVFYMHPVSRDDVISKKAVEYMQKMVATSRDSLVIR